MNPIAWPDLVNKLMLSGLTQPQLAEAVGCGQSTISDLLNGKTTDPRTSTGLALIRLAGGAVTIPERDEPLAMPETTTEISDAA